MKRFLELRENVKTADRKPEIYTKPDGKKGTRMVPVDREVIKQEKTLEWLKSALAREAKKVKPRQDDMEEAYEQTMYCKKCGCERGNPDPECSCKMENASLTDSQCYSEQSRCGSMPKKEGVNELTIADVQKATAMAKKRQAKEREAGKKSVSTTDLAARMPKKEGYGGMVDPKKRAEIKKKVDANMASLKKNNPGYKPDITKVKGYSGPKKENLGERMHTHAVVDKKGVAHGFAPYKLRDGEHHIVKKSDGKTVGTADNHNDAKTMMKRHAPGGTITSTRSVKLKKPMDRRAASKVMGKSIQGQYHEATIPDGQTAMTKTPAMKDKDRKTMGKIADLMKRANESNVDEISKGMASRYIKKAQVSTADAAKSTERGYTDSRSPDRDIAKAGKAQTRKGIKTFINRNKGTSTAVDKLTGKAKVPAKEGMNELSMSMKDLTKTGLNKAASPDKDKIRKGLDALKKAGNKKADAEAGERRKKMSELSNNKMGQYVRKAADDAAKKGAAGDTKKAQARVKGVSKAMDKIDHNRLFGRQG